MDMDRDDPEEKYRAGYQHGANAALIAFGSGLGLEKLKHWIEVDLQRWRHDRHAEPAPPKPTKANSDE
jgi:hypothetical protein